MTTEIVAQEVRPQESLKLTAAEIRADVQLIQQVLKAVMKKDVHYGIIPGCKKPSLLKPGAEKIMVTFRLNGEPLIEEFLTPDEKRIRIRMRITHQITKDEIGWGVGECSSSEEKYKWRKAYLAEYNATPEDRRRLKYYDEGKPTMQVRTNIADVANTVLKIAKKRALVDATLTCTGASDVFDQDLEDMDENLRQNVADNPKRPPMPQAAAPATAAPAADDANDSIEDPPPAGKPDEAKRLAIDLATAREITAKFDQPCKFCRAPINTGTKALYIDSGPDKGRYCVSHAAAR